MRAQEFGRHRMMPDCPFDRCIRASSSYRIALLRSAERGGSVKARLVARGRLRRFVARAHHLRPVGEGHLAGSRGSDWEEFERGRRHLHEYRAALQARDDLREVEALWGLSVVEWRAGNWELAARYAEDLLALAAQTGAEAGQPIFDLVPAAIAAHRGQVEEARARAEHALARAVEFGNRRAQVMHLWLLGFIELSLGNPAPALGNLRRAWEIYDELGYFEPGHRLELADTFEALIAVGELDEAERRLVPWEGRSRALDRAWAVAITRLRCEALAKFGHIHGEAGVAVAKVLGDLVQRAAFVDEQRGAGVAEVVAPEVGDAGALESGDPDAAAPVVPTQVAALAVGSAGRAGRVSR
jgi:tetratricopeptide (TPR) repeat protein